MHDGRIEEILEVLLPPPDNVPSRGQQPPTPTVFASARAVARLASWYPSAASGVPQANHSRWDSFFNLTASLTAGVHHWDWGFPPRQAPQTLRPQLRVTASTIDVENMVHSDSMSPTSLGICSKLSRRWELNRSLAEGSARHSQQTLTMRLGLSYPDFSSFFKQPAHREVCLMCAQSSNCLHCVVQQKVLGIIPSSTAGGAQTYTTFQPHTTTLNIKPSTPGAHQQVLGVGGQIRPGMTMIRTPIQQTGAVGKTILRTPLVVQQGQGGQQVVTQIIRGQPVSTGISAASPVTTVTGQGVASPNAAGQAAVQTPPCTPRAQGQSQVKLTMAQLTQLTQVCEGDTPGVLCYLVF
ncbi:hypothetical protein AMECASPLE_034293 [Ameca splendens]|uniref:Transcription initiation factor TFIID subunit 4 n=1 Tax=Ameca splendens TaxID=208324 RepID=A0ABV0YI94_9TELE